MATHPSAEKRSRQSVKRAARNQSQRSELKTITKKILGSKSKEETASLLNLATSKFHKAAQGGLLHWKAAARKISRLTGHFNRLSS